jgi:pimeloyl-ACP methyl ester carboxylesterase
MDRAPEFRRRLDSRQPSLENHRVGVLAEPAARNSQIREQAILIGPDRSLVGVLTPPDPGATPRDVTIVILNSGIIHRVGANRIHVEIARDLSAAGFRVLRFDLSGIGDSPSSDANGSLLESALKDIGVAVDHAVGSDGRVVLLGLCSGAFHAVAYASSDPRVVGLVLLDLWIPRTRQYHLRKTWMRAKNRDAWQRLFNGTHRFARFAKGLVRLGPSGKTEVAPSAVLDASNELVKTISESEARTIVADAFRPVLARGIPILAVFTAGLPNQHNYPTQLIDAFPEFNFLASTRLEWFPDSNHTFSSLAGRRRLRNLIASWMNGLGGEKAHDARALASDVD